MKLEEYKAMEEIKNEVGLRKDKKIIKRQL
jgi:hypothetical protein